MASAQVDGVGRSRAIALAKLAAKVAQEEKGLQRAIAAVKSSGGAGLNKAISADAVLASSGEDAAAKVHAETLRLSREDGG